MKTFNARNNLNEAYQFLGFEANGDCSIIINLKGQPFVYVHTHYLPLFKSLYGPLTSPIRPLEIKSNAS